MTYVLTKDELYHHGIPGQKWGVRRFQNTDGTYTAEGKKRYGLETVKKVGKTAFNVVRNINKDITDAEKNREKNGLYNKSKIPKNAKVDGPSEYKIPKGAMSEQPKDVRVESPEELKARQENHRKAIKRVVAAGSAVLAAASMATYLQSKINKEKMKQASVLGEQLAAKMYAKYGIYPAGGGLLLINDIYDPLPIYKKTIKL